MVIHSDVTDIKRHEKEVADREVRQINGIEAVAYFRQEYPSIPVIILTGYPDVNLATEFLKGGVVEYLVKPIEKSELLAAVTNAADQRRIFSGP